jgi:hypothetical protein
LLLINRERLDAMESGMAKLGAFIGTPSGCG